MYTDWHNTKCGTIAVMAFIWLLINPGIGYSDDEAEIVHWVAGQLRIQSAYTLPVIKSIEKAELSKIFASGSKRVMTRWVADHGQADADKLMRVYLETAVGLFDPKTRVIYIGGFLSQCRQKAILAHEVTHYFQYVVRGPITGGGMAAEMLLMEREIEACAMEQRYGEQRCNDTDAALYTAAISINEPLYIP